MFCPDCKKRMLHVQTDNENYICKHCNLAWLIVEIGSAKEE
jgi:uncharacterized protein YbaR (Trm112 family)